MDSDLQEVIHLTLNNWPKKEDRLNRGVKPYFTHSEQKYSIFPKSDSDSTKSQNRNATINTHRISWIKQMPRMSKYVRIVT